MKICNVCKTVLEDSAIYCPRCTSQSFSAFQTKRCPFCNTTVAVGTIVCSNCHKILPPEVYVQAPYQQTQVVKVVEANPNEMKLPPVQVQTQNVPPVQQYNGGNPQNFGVDFAVPKLSPDNGHSFNPNERLVQILPSERLEELAFDRIILENENENFGRPEQYAELYPNEAQPLSRAYDIVEYEQSPYRPIPTNDTYISTEVPNEEGKVQGFSESSARLNDRINSKIAKKDETVSADALFENLNQKYSNAPIPQPQVMTREEAERQNKGSANAAQPYVVQPNKAPQQTYVQQEVVGNSNEQIVKNAFADLNSQQRVLNKNEGSSQTFIYNQVYPTQPIKDESSTPRILPNKSTDVKNPKASAVPKGTSSVSSKKVKTQTGALAAMFSTVFLIVGLVASLLLIEINFRYEKISGLELFVAYLPNTIASLFPSEFVLISGNGFLTGSELAMYKMLPYLYMGGVGLTVLSILSHLFCFRATTGRAAYLVTLGLLTFLLSMAVLVIILLIFNFATIGYGIMFLSGGALLSVLTLAIGYNKKKNHGSRNA